MMSLAFAFGSCCFIAFAAGFILCALIVVGDSSNRKEEETNV